MSSTAHRILLLAAVAALPLACGDDDSGGGGGDIPEGAIVVDTTNQLEFRPDAISAPAGSITIALENDGSIEHSFVIEDLEDDLRLFVSGSGDTDSGTIDLETGDYTFYCDVPGHRGAGMEGSLTVE